MCVPSAEMLSSLTRQATSVIPRHDTVQEISPTYVAFTILSPKLSCARPHFYKSVLTLYGHLLTCLSVLPGQVLQGQECVSFISQFPTPNTYLVLGRLLGK